MNRLCPHPVYSFQSRPEPSDDVEMLQTDVMRFFAILCLCLTAIFALVKALPIAPPDVAPTIVEPADPKAEAQSLQKKVAALENKLLEMQARVRAATAAADHAAARAAKMAKTENAVLARIAKAKQELAEVSQMLNDTRQEIDAREFKLAVIVEYIATKRQVAAELKDQIKNETLSLAKLQAKMERIQEKLDANLQNSRQTPQRQPPVEKHLPEPASEGFTLRFASDEALEALISDGSVKFYAIAAKKAWRLILSGGRPVYIAAQFPRQIYEMEILTVPTHYTAVFRQQVAAFGQGTLTWGVTLPGQTAESIRLMVKGRDGGDLVISAGGEVTLN